MALTDRQIQTGRTAGPDLFLNDGKGLYLRIRPSGRKSWLYRYKGPDRKTQWLDLGESPFCSLNDARLKAAELKIQRVNGLDPVEEKHKNSERQEIEKAVEKASSRTRLTLLELFNSWEKRELADRKDKGAEVRRSFQKDVFPALGLIPAKDIKRAMIVGVLDKVVERGARIIARNLLGDLRQMFGYAITREIIENDPTYRLKRDDFGKKTERERILTKAEIKSLPEKLIASKLAQSSIATIWVMLSTCCRVGEISRAAWKDIDLDGRVWRIPPENAKNLRAHTIYLSAFATQQFKELKVLSQNSPWVLPSRLTDQHVCQKSLSKQIGDRQRGEKAPMTSRSLHTNALEMPGGKWTSHDLRTI